jgi:hypothetical protein
MYTHHPAYPELSNLRAALQRYDEAGIDPAFDADTEELERQFAEIRLSLATN